MISAILSLAVAVAFSAWGLGRLLDGIGVRSFVPKALITLCINIAVFVWLTTAWRTGCP